MAQRESAEQALLRWEMLELVQAAYPTFEPFLEDVMTELGFSTTEIQKDIAEFLEHGPHYLMIQAQRGQAKTTITAAYAVWCLIHDPRLRVLILSAGGTQANEISTLIVRIIQTMDVLECLRPDRNAGDRTSVEAFDVHHSLKGLDKSPSVACVGITGNLQGKRADLLIADDIESQKNALTEHQRQTLLNLTRDFPSICSTGRIVYLGTPQSVNSIYNTLPGRGYTVRIWTGRYPTKEQLENYGGMIAPMILRRLEADPTLGEPRWGPLGDQGAPTDTELPAGTEEYLCKKETDQGPSYFQLQHMLNTKLADADRYPLRLIKIQSVRIMGDMFPMAVQPGLLSQDCVSYEVNGITYTLGVPSTVSDDRSRLQGIVMHVDPAGGGKNGDETGYAVVGFLNGNIWVLDVGGVPGGYSVEGFKKLSGIARDWKVNRIIVEKNFGFGAYLNTWLPILRGEYVAVNNGDGPNGCAIEEVYETGQKELRIIDTLEPVIARGALIFNDEIARRENASLAGYSLEKRNTYSLFHQIAFITRDKQSLQHDDRLDALAGAVRYWVRLLGVDQEKAIEAQRAAEFEAWRKNPLGRPVSTAPRGGSLMNRYKR
ncbi:large terminase subunit-like protein [Burkholderia phage AMP1]|uniref:Large terminase subunit-like protein n=5 Tax=Ampunavirus BpAMP1 TaxID=2733589 RepID=A0A5C2IBI9_9CAUD|nr:terminase large subunit [Burkholderia phage Bp-AMP1]QEP52869.1 large terminase subunit-like protein [Burkholderia phage AMP1]CDL65158.1 TerL large terminase subunit-like protein [Burkholderia phage Bp-AMP2]CDL65199.1 TerL large terminase subunit-like protein [Burkholderia phage Bp-AMP3]CDL65239.1 TerL large terminase subunit-like protein [Burkholderia phage Bp-AMP4]CDK30071.1 TerL large terminase subunit-like protein [Burkholderia phage Bp-AMP1]